MSNNTRWKPWNFFSGTYAVVLNAENAGYEGVRLYGGGKTEDVHMDLSRTLGEFFEQHQRINREREHGKVALLLTKDDHHVLRTLVAREHRALSEIDPKGRVTEILNSLLARMPLTGVFD